MAVTRQEYSIEPTWTSAQLLDNLLGPAFIAAGLMTNWYDSFSISDRRFRVMEITYDNTKTYGKTYYVFSAYDNQGQAGVSLATGWDPVNHVPLGTQFLDYHLLPVNMTNMHSIDWQTSPLIQSRSHTTRLTLVRYTSQANPKQSWFVFRQGTVNGVPFSILRGDAQLYSHLDLTKGIISGFTNCYCQVTGTTGYLGFALEENLRRVLCIGGVLNGHTDTTFGNDRFHGLSSSTHSYYGVGRFSNDYGSNMSERINVVRSSAVPLPVGHSGSNPAYTTNYSPICTDLPWTIWTSEALASDFGVYMHYADNNITYNDRFVVTPGIEEWEVIAFANNATVDFGASSCLVARVV